MPHFGHVIELLDQIFANQPRKLNLESRSHHLFIPPGWRGLYPVADFIIRTSIDRVILQI